MKALSLTIQNLWPMLNSFPEKRTDGPKTACKCPYLSIWVTFIYPSDASSYFIFSLKQFQVLITLQEKPIEILYEKDKLLVTNIFSFSHNIFFSSAKEGIQPLETSLTLSQTTNFRLFQIERVCRRQFQDYWKWQKALQTGRKHCGKRRNCSLRAISPFPTVFSKDLYCRHVKTRACLGKG